MLLAQEPEFPAEMSDTEFAAALKGVERRLELPANMAAIDRMSELGEIFSDRTKNGFVLTRYGTALEDSMARFNERFRIEGGSRPGRLIGPIWIAVSNLAAHLDFAMKVTFQWISDIEKDWDRIRAHLVRQTAQIAGGKDGQALISLAAGAVIGERPHCDKGVTGYADAFGNVLTAAYADSAVQRLELIANRQGQMEAMPHLLDSAKPFALSGGKALIFKGTSVLGHDPDGPSEPLGTPLVHAAPDPKSEAAPFDERFRLVYVTTSRALPAFSKKAA